MISRFNPLIAVAASAVLVGSIVVAGQTGLHSASAAPPPTPTAPEGWSYEGNNGPAAWASIDFGEVNHCAGTRQSPVNLLTQSAVVGKNLSPIVWSYKPIPLQISNIMTISVTNSVESYITIKGDRYDLANFHFHSPSQHTFDGNQMALELDLVHFRHKYGSLSVAVAQSDGLAVVALVFKIGKDDNAALKPIWDNMRMPARTSKMVNDVSVDLAKLLPQNAGYYTYPGSITTPPCSQNVQWYVLSQTAEISAAQFAQFRQVVPGPTNRPVQPLNGRTVVQFKP